MKKHNHLCLAVLLCSILSAAAVVHAAVDGGMLLAQKSKVQPAAPQIQRIMPAVTLEPTVQVLILNPNMLSPSQTSSGTVMLSGAAGSTGTTVSLTSSSLDVTVPSNVTVASGETSASFMVMVRQSAQGGSVTISAQNATGAGMTKQATLVITSDVQVKSVQFTSDDTCSVQIRPGYSCQATVFLDRTPTSGIKVNLSSSSTAVGVAGSGNIAAGAFWTKVPVQIALTAAPGQATISAVRDGPGGVAKQITLNILAPPKITSFTVTSEAAPGSQIFGTVTLDGWLPPAGMNVMLMSSSPSVTVPATVPVTHTSGKGVSPQDALGSSGYFTGAVASTASDGDVTIGAIISNSGSAGKDATVKIRRPGK